MFVGFLELGYDMVEVEGRDFWRGEDGISWGLGS